MNDQELLENLIGFDALYSSMYKCKKNVSWKTSVLHYYLNGVESTLKLEKQLKDGTYKAGRPHKFMIMHPKKREAISISFRDRVYQRSLNDNIIYPRMTKSFINENCACQKDKGLDFARDIMKKYIRHMYNLHGLEFGYVKIDIEGYYQNMNHAINERNFKRKLPEVVYGMTQKIMRDQYKGEVGYNPGSQMIQIAGISFLDELDHFIKEELHIKCYVRYMDDFYLFHHDMDYLEYCYEKILIKLEELKMKPNEKKTYIAPITKQLKFLGFYFKLTDTGKVLMLADPKKIKEKRKNLTHMVARAKAGYMSKEECNKALECHIAHLSKGNTYKLCQRQIKFYKNLWKEN